MLRPAGNYLSDPASWVASDRPNSISIGAPAPALGLGDTRTTSLRLRTCRFATMEAATGLTRLRSDLAAAAGSRLGSAKELALTPAWRRLVRCQRHVPVLLVRPHDARKLVASSISTIFPSSAARPEIIGRRRVRTVTL